MSIYEYDEEAARQAIRIEEYERGIAEGIEQGIERGIAKGIEALILDNLEAGFGKEEIVAKLIKRFGISKTEAERYYAATDAKQPLI